MTAFAAAAFAALAAAAFVLAAYGLARHRRIRMTDERYEARGRAFVRRG